MGVRPYRFEPRRAERVASVGDKAAQDTQNSVQVREEDDLSWFVFIMTKHLSKYHNVLIIVNKLTMP